MLTLREMQKLLIEFMESKSMDFDTMSRLILAKDSEISQAQEKLKILTQENCDLKEKVGHLTTKSESLENILSQKDLKFDVLEKSTHLLEKSISEKDATIEKMDKDCRKVLKQDIDLQALLEAKIEKMRESAHEISVLRRRLQENGLRTSVESGDEIEEDDYEEEGEEELLAKFSGNATIQNDDLVDNSAAHTEDKDDSAKKGVEERTSDSAKKGVEERTPVSNANLQEEIASLNAQKREKDNLHKRILELEKQLYDKQDLELEIERLKGNLNVIKQLRVEDDIEVKKKADEMNKNLKEKEDELEDLEALNLVLTVKERKSNDELQEARNKLIDALKGNSSRSLIGVRRMGELDPVTFKVASKRKYIHEDADMKSIEICSLWEELLRDSSWHPFKIVKVGDNHEEIIDEEDEKLSDLRREWGEDVYEAVTTALTEMNKYNASGRYPTPDLWNYGEGKRATISDGISYILRQKKRR